ncbi:hypothetical protein ABEF92_005072 [Exophiala dermatitidis]|nr:hypothetical protein HRR75_001475 [Exophiala dermatitidis]KAJ4560045.1 hypothetical protein HRR78_000569 [Exophiala dermatitidis]
MPGNVGANNNMTGDTPGNAANDPSLSGYGYVLDQELPPINLEMDPALPPYAYVLDLQEQERQQYDIDTPESRLKYVLEMDAATNGAPFLQELQGLQGLELLNKEIECVDWMARVALSTMDEDICGALRETELYRKYYGPDRITLTDPGQLAGLLIQRLVGPSAIAAPAGPVAFSGSAHPSAQMASARPAGNSGPANPSAQMAGPGPIRVFDPANPSAQIYPPIPSYGFVDISDLPPGGGHVNIFAPRNNPAPPGGPVNIFPEPRNAAVSTEQNANEPSTATSQGGATGRVNKPSAGKRGRPSNAAKQAAVKAARAKGLHEWVVNGYAAAPPVNGNPAPGGRAAAPPVKGKLVPVGYAAARPVNGDAVPVGYAAARPVNGDAVPVGYAAAPAVKGNRVQVRNGSTPSNLPTIQAVTATSARPVNGNADPVGYAPAHPDNGNPVPVGYAAARPVNGYPAQAAAPPVNGYAPVQVPNGTTGTPDSFPPSLTASPASPASTATISASSPAAPTPTRSSVASNTNNGGTGTERKGPKKPTRLIDVDDPWCCPICYQMFVLQNTARKHVRDLHPEVDHVTANIELRSYYWNQGIDPVYRGTDRKQIQAQRRMSRGIKSTDSRYFDDVYRTTPAIRAALRKERERENQQ